MNIIGEYTIQYDIYTMFNKYSINIKNHNLITKKGYEFFIKKWYTDDIKEYPYVLGYYHENKFYKTYHEDDTYEDEISLSMGGEYETQKNYIDKNTNKQYLYDGEKFVEFNEKISKICLGNYYYLDEEQTKPSESDTDLYQPVKEFEISDFIQKTTELMMKYEVAVSDLNNTTEIGVKTNHGRLVSHDIHPPYYFPFGTNVTLEYVFKLK